MWLEGVYYERARFFVITIGSRHSWDVATVSPVLELLGLSEQPAG